MRFNPCGRGVDMLRAAYTAPCRFWRDSDQVGTIRWYRCKPDAPPLGKESFISTTQQRGPYWLQAPVGEVLPFTFKFSPGTPVDGLDYEHVCGEDIDFASGGAYEPALPPVTYELNGLPTCCMKQADGVQLDGAMRMPEDDGVQLDGAMQSTPAGTPSLGGTIVPLDTRIYHLPSPNPGDAFGGWIIRTDFSGGTFRVDWLQEMRPTVPTGDMAIWAGYSPADPWTGPTSLGFVVADQGAASGSYTFTLPDGYTPVLIFGYAHAPPPLPDYPPRFYWFEVTKL